MQNSPSRTAAKLSSFTVATLWHRRLARARNHDVKVQPRVCAELILHPVPGHGAQLEADRSHPRNPLDACHAA